MFRTPKHCLLLQFTHSSLFQYIVFLTFNMGASCTPKREETVVFTIVFCPPRCLAIGLALVYCLVHSRQTVCTNPYLAISCCRQPLWQLPHPAISFEALLCGMRTHVMCAKSPMNKLDQRLWFAGSSRVPRDTLERGSTSTASCVFAPAPGETVDFICLVDVSNVISLVKHPNPQS